MREWVVVYAKGFCMGLADIVPGVSGGTIALITGIYERFVTAIAALDPRLLGAFVASYRETGFRGTVATFEEADLHFLVVLGLGVVSAVLLMSRVITALFEAYPGPLNGFFFGLIAASAVVIYRHTEIDTAGRIAVTLLGATIAFVASASTSGGDGGGLLAVFVAGAIAISAMVLPGISGAALLYILGQYQYMLAQLRDLTDAVAALVSGGSIETLVGPGLPVAVFLTGAVLGLLTMARVVKRALETYRMATLGFLVGLMVGALRLPIAEADSAVAVWSPELLAASVLAGVVGAAVVIALDATTDTLEYA
jgi:putative membrane protein